MKINIEIVNKINNIKHQVNHVKILQKQKADCVNLVLKKLKLKNVNELRDKFEGVKFYENYFQQFKCILALESVLNKKIIDWEKVRENPNLIFNDSKMEYQIVHFNY